MSTSNPLKTSLALSLAFFLGPGAPAQTAQTAQAAQTVQAAQADSQPNTAKQDNSGNRFGASKLANSSSWVIAAKQVNSSNQTSAAPQANSSNQGNSADPVNSFNPTNTSVQSGADSFAPGQAPVLRGLPPPATSLDAVDAPSPEKPILPLGSTGSSTGLPLDAPGAATGKAPDQSGLPPGKRREDYEVINTQAESFRARFLQGEAIELHLPVRSEMIPLSNQLPPIRLEATYTQPVSIRDVVQYCLENNLDIRIQNESVQQNKWLTIGAFGRFLPDSLMQYRSLFQQGTTLVGGVIPVTFKNPFVTVSSGFRYYGFQGGRVLFGSLSNLHTFRASRQLYHATINDALLNIGKLYYNLVNNQAQLQIQTRAVEVSKAQVDLNRQLEKAGTGTRFQVLQAETQLARDEQGLLQQEVDLRKAAIDLATALNLNATVNLLSVEAEVRKVRLIDPSLDINRLISIAVTNRPELKQFEELRIAAKRNIQVAAAPLYPQFQFFGQVAGTGQTLTGKHGWVGPSFTTAPLQTAATTNNTLGIVQNNIGVATSSSTTVPAVSVYTPPQMVPRRVRTSYQIGVQLDWNYLGLGVPDMANVQANRALARQANLKVNQTIMNVYQQVRESYLQSQTAERQIEVSTKEVLSSAEELRLARVRLANGVGTNIDVINAQRDFTQALVRKANAIINFNIQQVQLLHDIGIISYDTLTSGRLAK